MLTAEEKKLLREAICDGAFYAYDKDNEFPTNITPYLLEVVAGLSDDDIRAILKEHTTKKDNEKLARIAELEAELNKLKGV